MLLIKQNLKLITTMLGVLTGVIGAAVTIDSRYVVGTEYNIEQAQMNQKILKNRVDLLWSQYSALSQINTNKFNKKLISDRLKRIETEITSVQSQIK